MLMVVSPGHSRRPGENIVSFAERLDTLQHLALAHFGMTPVFPFPASATDRFDFGCRNSWIIVYSPISTIRLWR